MRVDVANKRTASPTRRKVGAVACGLAWMVAFVASVLPAHAANIDGNWSTDRGTCGQIFVKRGNQMHLAPDADIHGSGFVIDGTTIRGKIASCKITSRRQVGSIVHVRAACATEVAISNSAFDLKVVDDDQIVRRVPGIPEMDTPYYRCR